MNCRTLAFLIFCAGLSAQVVVVNGASGRVEQPVSPGSWAVVADVRPGTVIFPGVTTGTAPGFPASFPKSFNGVSVKVGGVDAAVWYVSNAQINFLIPFTAPLGVQPVVVTFGAGSPLTSSVRLISVAPGLFPLDVATPPKGAILNFRNGNFAGVNSDTNPAHRGETIQIYATGPGALSQSLQDGAPVPSSPLVTTTSTPQVFIGGVETAVQGSAMAPTLVGAWIINAVVPNLPFINGRVPIVVYMNGVDSNEVTVFVQ
jgi:uncharacterized protein (TIGR03437 family)